VQCIQQACELTIGILSQQKAFFAIILVQIFICIVGNAGESTFIARIFHFMNTKTKKMLYEWMLYGY
jgi:hypothetical protein